MTGDDLLTGVRFDVRGLPIAQGSARAFVARGRAIIATDANRLSSPLGAWRSAIATEAREAIGSTPPLTGPVRVDLRFRLPRPRSHFLPANGRRSEPVLRLDAPAYHAGKPDADKLTRAALDALSAVVFGDDAQVARLTVTKHYAGPSEGPGVSVAVQRAGDDTMTPAYPRITEKEMDMTTVTAAEAEAMAHDIAGQPGLNRHLIGSGDQILSRDGFTGYRMQDFLAEADLATYRTYVYGSPEASADAPCDDPPDQLDDCDGDRAGGHWGPGGRDWHYTTR